MKENNPILKLTLYNTYGVMGRKTKKSDKKPNPIFIPNKKKRGK